MTCDLGRADKNPSITWACLSLGRASLQLLGGLWEEEGRPPLTTCMSDPWRAFGMGEGPPQCYPTQGK